MNNYRHGFFKTIVTLNLLADVAMCVYCTIMSQSLLVSVGTAVLALCFFIVIPGLAMLRVSMKKSSAALIGIGYTLVNLLIGFVFACEFFRLIPEYTVTAEGCAIAGMVVVILIFVNVIVRRLVEGKL
ncbi:MAG: hypothetical protein ACI4K7_10410 [Oscillospiraceae bacterium]